MQEMSSIFAKLGAVLTDSHFEYTEGGHGSAYFNKDAVYPHAAETSRLCGLIAREFIEDKVEVVIAPAVGGCILSNRVAEHLSMWNKSLSEPEVLGIYADKAGDGFVVRRGYDKLIPGKRVLVVEDALNTGGSARKLVAVVRALGGEVIGVGVLCNRGGVTAEDLGVHKLNALLNIKLEVYNEADCPLCKAGVPINTNVGHGKEFPARGPDPAEKYPDPDYDL